jgi:hypothetical protein
MPSRLLMGSLDRLDPIGEEIWEHLVEITELIGSKSQKLIEDQKLEIKSLKHENKRLQKRNKELIDKLFELELLLNKSKQEDKENERVLLTQDTILSESDTNGLEYNHGNDPDLTDASPVKGESESMEGFSSNSEKYAELVKRRLFHEQLETSGAKKFKTEPLSDDHIFEVSQIDDSQGSDLLNNTLMFNNIGNNNNNKTNRSASDKVDLTKNFQLNRPWYPEDFIKNPEYEKHVNDRSVHIKSLPKYISDHYERQQKHIRSIAMKEFNNISTLSSDKENFNPIENNYKYGLITPPQNVSLNYQNELISAIFKFEINKENLSKYLKIYPNLLRTNKVKDWDLEDSLSNDVCADFLLTQEVQDKNKKALEKAQLKALRMLFQACFVVENGKQIGRYIFRNPALNQIICKSDFVIDLGIFK